MTNQQILSVLESTREKILENTLALICKEQPIDALNHAFSIENANGGVGITSFSSQVFLDNTFFLTLKGYQLPSMYDYDADCESPAQMYADEDFIREYFAGIIEEAINDSILSLEIQ